jgi:hypothetical protein
LASLWCRSGLESQRARITTRAAHAEERGTGGNAAENGQEIGTGLTVGLLVYGGLTAFAAYQLLFWFGAPERRSLHLAAAALFVARAHALSGELATLALPSRCARGRSSLPSRGRCSRSARSIRSAASIWTLRGSSPILPARCASSRWPR